MAHRAFSVGRALAVGAALCGIGLVSCDDGEVAWETSADAVGALESDRSHADEIWRLSRDEVVIALDTMKRALEAARREGAVVDKTEIDGLQQRIRELRDEFIAETGEAHEDSFATRSRLETRFKALRSDVDGYLTRIDHIPDDMANWQDVE